jgi:hypothetical protein
MGLFGTFAYSEGRWTRDRPTAVPFLLVDVHDSRFATVDYRCADASGGRFHLGYEPRFYFDEPGAGVPVDTQAEAHGFAAWVREAAGREIDPADVRPLLASPEGAPPTDDTVEPTVETLLALAGIPVPDWGTGDDAGAV